MQDRYVGDAGDFAKYGLLRHLAGVCDRMSERSLGIIWYLVDDESHNRDGRHLAYLRAPALRDCDPDLRVILKQLLETGERSVSVIEQGGVLAKGTRFFQNVFRRTSRWFGPNGSPIAENGSSAPSRPRTFAI
jgi:hypothetical protein